jgi:hypothetical protein
MPCLHDLGLFSGSLFETASDDLRLNPPRFLLASLLGHQEVRLLGETSKSFFGVWRDSGQFFFGSGHCLLRKGGELLPLLAWGRDAFLTR